jgi:hypothetical protein
MDFPSTDRHRTGSDPGSYNRPKGSRMWARANESILPPLRRDASRVHDWALANGHPELAEPLLLPDERRASDQLSPRRYKVINELSTCAIASARRVFFGKFERIVDKLTHPRRS